VRVEVQIEADYGRARSKALWRQLVSRLTRRPNELLRFEEVRQRLRARAQHYGGLRVVPVAQIIGSVGRYRDFDRAFLPRQTGTKERWVNIDWAHHTEVPLPPVELYQVGETYFVKDGNHRVSVAREHGEEFIDAFVVEVQAPVPIASVVELEEWTRRQDAVDFLVKTRLMQVRPDARVDLTLPGQYEKLLEHVDVHRWFLGIEAGRPIPYEEAVASWYDRVYLPLVEVIRASDILREFPHRTEADLYLWLIEHLWYLRQAGDLTVDRPLDDIVRAYAEAYSERPTKRLARVIAAGWRFPEDLTRRLRSLVTENA
jgi:hypothetical protein